MTSPATVQISDIQYDTAIYPREKWNTHTIDEYVDVLRKGGEFPAIVLEEGTNRILDGVHRWKAHLKYTDLYQEHLDQPAFFENGKWAEPATSIPVVWAVVPDDIPAKLYAASFSRRHGRRIDTSDCKALAREIFEQNPDFSIGVLSQYLEVSKSTAHSYVQDMIAQRREERQAIAFRLSLLGWTQSEIGEAVGGSQQRVQEILPVFPDLEKPVKNLIASGIPHAEVARRQSWSEQLVWAVALSGLSDTDRMDKLNITVSPYDVWSIGKCHDLLGAPYPGRIPGQLVAHVLYFFTEPGDMVIDPMAGSGTTQDTCLVMGRKCYAYDLNMETKRPDVIRHDMLDGWPERTKKADMIFWDPPYFDKKDNEYIEGSISGFDRDDYLTFFTDRFKEAYDLVKRGARIAFLMSDWDDPTDETPGIFVWDYANALHAAGWQIKRHIQCPLPTQLVHPDIVNKFRKSRRLARLERYLLIGVKA